MTKREMSSPAHFAPDEEGFAGNRTPEYSLVRQVRLPGISRYLEIAARS